MTNQAPEENKVLSDTVAAFWDGMDFPAEEREIVQLAFDLAERFHRGQKRRSGLPYIVHTVSVATILKDLRMDAVTIAAGLLHDTLEDTELSLEELKRLFPEPLPSLVEGVTKINRMQFVTSREAQIENIRKIILAMARDIRVLVIKLADRLHNMRTLRFLSEHRRQEIAQETLDIYAPLANRLGMVKIKSELEDLAMYWLYPTEYKALARKVAQKKIEREDKINKAIDDLTVHLETNGIFGAEISGRPKHFYSIFQKMEKSGLSFEQIYDLNALRIFCNTKSECYEILGLIHNFWAPQPNRFKDYIALPKPNNYQSLHTTVIGHEGILTEVQIRTHEMHDIAEHGIAAHWRYKEGKQPHGDDDRFLRWLRDLSAWIQDPGDPNSVFDALKMDVFADVVLCFTPKGDVIELPGGATPIDFAFAIHTKVGLRCMGAKVNKRMVTLKTELKHGDIVEIETSNTGHPSRDWLEFAKTGRARSKIKHFLKSQEMSTWVNTGRENLTRLLKERNIDVPKAELEARLEEIKKAFRLETADDVLAEIGFGSISAQAALRRMNPDWTKKHPKKRLSTEKKTNNQIPILVEGMEGLQVRIANCCRPIPGDEIVGFVTRGRGITVHHKKCSSITRLESSEDNTGRILDASWNITEGHVRNVIVRVEAEDRTHLLLEFTSALSNLNIFITGINSRRSEDYGTVIIDFDLQIFEQNQLQKIIQMFYKIKGVSKAERLIQGVATQS
ncbi:MAG: RelA/SpoT family protein [Sumerlaeia bacterium]